MGGPQPLPGVPAPLLQRTAQSAAHEAILHRRYAQRPFFVAAGLGYPREVPNLRDGDFDGNIFICNGLFVIV